jgi:pimeloyl-ACP methyl ester carboxylesterase
MGREAVGSSRARYGATLRSFAQVSGRTWRTIELVRARCGDIEMAWSEWGSGEPLVLVHGLRDDHRAWSEVLPWLAPHRRVIACDLRGHGETSLGAADGTLAQLAGDLVAFLDAAGLQRADLCGFSLGGTIVLRVAIDHPDRVGRLVPVATSSRVGRAAVAWYEEQADQADEPGHANACRAMARLGTEPLDPELRRVRARTLVVAAERDELCPPRAGAIIAAGIPGARLRVVPGAGHHVARERPEELGRAVLSA